MDVHYDCDVWMQEFGAGISQGVQIGGLSRRQCTRTKILSDEEVVVEGWTDIGRGGPHIKISGLLEGLLIAFRVTQRYEEHLAC